MFENDIKKTPAEVAGAKMAEIKLKKEELAGKNVAPEVKKKDLPAEKKTEETDNASGDSQSKTEKTSGETDEAKKKELQAKKDAELQSASSDASRESQKKNKVQERIDKLVREREEEKEGRIKDQQRINDLEKEMNALKNPPKKEDHFVTIEKERIVKYINDDAGKPLADRKEMSKEELSDWALEDSLAATEWVTNRTLRRAEEKKADESDYRAKCAVDELLFSQKPSIAKVIKDHPELDTSIREEELSAEGKGKQEIFNILCKENDKYKIVQEVLSENPSFYTKTNGPELAMVEMEKRMKSVKSKGGDDQLDRDAKLKADAAEAERQRQADVDEAGADSSSRNGVIKNKVKKGEEDVIRDQIIKRSGLGADRVNKRIAHRNAAGIR